MKGRILAVFVLMALIMANKAFAQSVDQIDQWVKQLESRDWKERQKIAFALVNLSSELKTYKVKKALIDELEREFNRVSKGDFEKCIECEDGGEQEYYSWLFEAVAEMKDDQAFPLFVRIGAPDALAKYGDKGIAVILDKLDYKNFGGLSAAITVLKETLKPKKEGYITQDATRKKIKQAMIKALKENKHPEKSMALYETRANEFANIRIEAVRALGYLAESGDTEVLPIIKSAAEEDSYYIDMSKKKDYKGPQMKYVVREEAQKILNQLKEKGIQK